MPLFTSEVKVPVENWETTGILGDVVELVELIGPAIL